jgi:hypothetical protein
VEGECSVSDTATRDARLPQDRPLPLARKLVRYNMLLWNTDAVDGRIARRSKTPPSWVGERDVLVDSTLTLGTGIALARSGYLPGKLVVAWLGTCLVLYAIRPVATLVLAFM